MKTFSLFITASAIAIVTLLFSTFNHPSTNPVKKATALNADFFIPAQKAFSPATVSDVVTKALAFKALLTTSQQSTLQQTYTITLARKWSNLPCGSGCRNGIEFSTLTTDQLAAAKEVVAAALGASSNHGYDLFNQILLADNYLNANGGGSGYGAGLYFISYLNTPSTTGTWMLQIGGHHMAFNIAFNNGQVVGATPEMAGVEPTSFTVSSTTYTPLATKHAAMAALLASLTSAQLTTAKLSTTFSDCLMSPGESNGNTNSFPSTKQGLVCSGLSTAQKNLLIAAMEEWVDDVDATSASTLIGVYTNDINSTYIAYTGSGTSGSSSTFLNANTNYVRIDGPRVWIEFVCQSGVVFQTQIHFHSVWRDHVKDYGTDLASAALPLTLTDINVTVSGNTRTITWNTANEINVNHFIVERSTDGINFYSIQTVNAKNGNGESYSVSDAEPLNTGVVYYRLKMVDKDGSYTLSKIVTAKISMKNSVRIYPNPVGDGNVQIILESATSGATVKVIAMDGKIAISKEGLSGQTLSLNMASLPKGTYTVIVSDKNGSYKTKLVK